MAMIFIDGFDYIINTNQGLKWTVISSNPSIITPGIYTKGSAGQALNQYVIFPTNYVTGMIGFHIFINSYRNTEAAVVWLDSTLGSSTQVELRLDGSGGFYFTSNNNVIGSTVASSFRLSTGQWYWVEAQVTISLTVGVANLYINGVSALAQSSLNTRQGTTNTFFTAVGPWPNGSFNNYIIDNFHFWDTTAGDVSSFPYGEHIIDTQLATGVGANTTWSNSGAATNFGCINEAHEDADTTYVFTNSSGNIDSYAFANLAETTGTIGTIAVNLIERVDDGLGHVVQMFTQSSAATVLSSNVSPGAAYSNSQRFFGTDPNTSTAWKIAGRNAAKFGQKLIV
jgi:hypothetical protein